VGFGRRHIRYLLEGQYRGDWLRVASVLVQNAVLFFARGAPRCAAVARRLGLHFRSSDDPRVPSGFRLPWQYVWRDEGGVFLPPFPSPPPITALLKVEELFADMLWVLAS
jgi:hypothetical protein